jgi:hypothetical protein
LERDIRRFLSTYEPLNYARNDDEKDETTRFVVGYNATAIFSMLRYADTFTGDGFVGSDLRHYGGITRIEAFDLGNPKHAEFIAFYEYATQREQRRAIRAR